MTRNKRGPVTVTPGRCGFGKNLGLCDADRQPGIWGRGGSWMCPIHEEVLRPIREEIEREEDPFDTRHRANTRRMLAGIDEDYEGDD